MSPAPEVQQLGLNLFSDDLFSPLRPFHRDRAFSPVPLPGRGFGGGLCQLWRMALTSERSLRSFLPQNGSYVSK